MDNLVITVFLKEMGTTEEGQARATAEFLRTLADELDEHGRFGAGANPCFAGDGRGPVAEYRLVPWVQRPRP